LFKKHRCQADGCHANLATYSFYYQRNHICTEHLKSESFFVHSVASRFCQRCGLSHALTEFDGKRKSCRVALEKHNNRRKARVENTSGATTGAPAGAANGGQATSAATAAAAANGLNDIGAQNFSGFPGVADLSGWDPNLAKELEALLSDDPIIELPPNYLANAASGALGGIPATAIGALNQLQPQLLEYTGSGPTPNLLPNVNLQRLNTGDGNGNGGDGNGAAAAPEQPELGCDGQPLSPTLLRLARIDTNARGGNELEYQQMLASSPFALDLPSLNNLTQQQPQVRQQQQPQQQQYMNGNGNVNGTSQSSGAVPFSFPFNGVTSSTGTPTLEPVSSTQLQTQIPQQQQQQQPIQFIVVAPGMSLPNGLQVIPHHPAAAAMTSNGSGPIPGMQMAMQMTPQMLPPQVQQQLGATVSGQGSASMVVQPMQAGQQMQWVLMPSNMVMMQQQQQQSPSHQHPEGSSSQPEQGTNITH
jgi:hypothetical protein